MNSKLIAMAIIRMSFGLLSLGGGLLMLYYRDLQAAVKINSFIGSIGPFVLLGVSTIGVAGLATQMDPRKLFMLVAGVALILLGTR